MNIDHELGRVLNKLKRMKAAQNQMTPAQMQHELWEVIRHLRRLSATTPINYEKFVQINDVYDAAIAILGQTSIKINQHKDA